MGDDGLPLTLTNFLERARRFFPKKEIVSRGLEGKQSYTYREFYERVCRLANALEGLGIKEGDRVGTFAWNHYRHLELYFAAPCMGAILHTVNIRLFPDQIVYILNHAEDKILFIDEELVPLIEGLKERIKTVQRFVIMTDKAPPKTSLAPAHPYEELLNRAAKSYAWPTLDEWTPAGLCYTSGTTGDPKGVVYSHRGLSLHSFAFCLSDPFGLCERDVAMPVVPMFHANAWGIPYAATMVGAKQVFPGPRPDPKAIAELIQSERVTFTAGVPTLWIGLLQLLEKERYDLSSLRGIGCGGSAVPQSLIEAYEKKLGIQIIQGWGMTETSPLAAASWLKSHMQPWPEAKKFQQRAKQGLILPGLEFKVVDEQGREVPWDGKSRGELLVKGPWVAKEYYKDPRSVESFKEGWLHTGDVAAIDEEGYIIIVDRLKDVIKSGGEWISSVDLEGAIMAHPKVLEAAVIAIPHEQWQERPLACVVPKPNEKLTKEEILDSLKGKFANWWLPDDIVFMSEIPKTSVGKFDKKVLREQFKTRGGGQMA